MYVKLNIIWTEFMRLCAQVLIDALPLLILDTIYVVCAHLDSLTPPPNDSTCSLLTRSALHDKFDALNLLLEAPIHLANLTMQMLLIN
jgi:hypothetical protein